MLHIDIRKDSIKVQPLNNKDAKICKKKLEHMMKQAKNESHSQQKLKGNKSKTSKQKQKQTVQENGLSEDPPGDEDCLDSIEEMFASNKSGYDICIPLYVTAAIDSPEKIQHFFQRDAKTGRSKHDPNGRCLNDGSTPLHIAIRAKKLDVVKILLQNGADISITDCAGENVLMRAVRTSDANMVNTVWAYRTEDLDIDHTNTEGMTALHIATDIQWENCLSFLLHNKADPNVQDKKKKRTPLMIAAANGDNKIAEHLLRAGADVLLEDREGFTSIYKAFEKEHADMVDILFRSISEEEKELFIKARLDYILEPPAPEEEKIFLADMYFPLLAECTNHRELKAAFYNQKAIHRIAYKIEEHIQSVDIVISGSHLLFCIMFRFGDNVDPKFLRQYLNCKGPDLTIEVTKYYTEVWKMSERSIIAVFLPMIGLAVIPEGRTWIKKHYLSVSEYINFFKKENLKQYIAPNPEFAWCLTKGQFGKIYRIWNTFYDVVNDIQTEQREKNMNELLEEEEREKERQVKKKQKKKRKRNDKSKTEIEQIASNVDTGSAKQKQPDGRDCIGKACTNENAKKDDCAQGEKVPLKNACKNNISKAPVKSNVLESDFPALSDQWTTVQSKKHANKDKPGQTTKQVAEQTKPDMHDKHATKESRRKKKLQKVKPIIQTKTQIPVLNCTGTARWADIAKVKPKAQENNVDHNGTISHIDATTTQKSVPFVASDFPTLGYKSPVKTIEKYVEKPGTFTFYFHDECTVNNENKKQESTNEFCSNSTIDPTTITFLGDLVDDSIGDCHSDVYYNDKENDWTWENVAEIGEYNHVHDEETTSIQTHDIILEEQEITDANGIGMESEPKYGSTYDKSTEHQVNGGSTELIDENANIEYPPENIIEQTNGDGATHSLTLSGNESETEGIEMFFETDETFVETLDNIPKWAEELDDFGDENTMTTEVTIPSFFKRNQTEAFSDNTVPLNQLVEDIAYTDPAIIGCGGLHIPQEQTQPLQFETEDPHLVNHRQKQESRLLGKVIKTDKESQVRQENDDHRRNHKGWSKKRRVKSKHEETPTLSTRNWIFGDKLLETAQQLEQEMSMEGVSYPECLRGETEHEETHYFPSFHTNTRLSAQIDPIKISLIHQLQITQLVNRQNFINSTITSTQDETLFAYYASCAGVNKDEFYKFIDQMRSKTSPYVHGGTLRDLIARQQNQRNQTANDGSRQAWIHNNNSDYQRSQTDDMNDTDYDDTDDYLNDAATNLYNYQSYSMGCKKFNTESSNLVIEPQTLGIPPNKSPSVQSMSQDQANIYTIQNVQSAMQREFVNKIQDMYKGILKDKITSVRWRNNLWDMRNLPVEKQTILSKMVIPADEKDRSYISINRTDSTVLGFLTDGTEVAIRIIDGQTREFTQKELQHLVDLDVSKYFMVKYRDYCFHDGLYYVALDLYEYNLADYLVHMERDGGGRDWNLTHDKLIWQLLRGLESLHQSCLMVHGELRPDSVVVDVDGNVRIAGYGMGRNVGRDGPFMDYTDEEQCWLAPEVLVHKQKVTFKSDIWVAGMLTYYILSDGKNPFGSEIADIVWNIGNQGYAMTYINEEANHLLCLMLSVNKSERPCISEALKHPYFWGQEKQLRFVIIAGSDVLRDVKAGVPMSGAVKDSMISIIGTTPCHLNLVNWTTEVEPAVMREMKSFRQYKNNVVELVLFVYNCCTHFDTLSPTVREVIEEPCKYFLTKFPTLFMTVYRAIRKSSKADRPCYKAFW